MKRNDFKSRLNGAITFLNFKFWLLLHNETRYSFLFTVNGARLYDAEIYARNNKQAVKKFFNKYGRDAEIIEFLPYNDIY